MKQQQRQYKVLVTGGAGFIGCNLVTELVRQGHIVRVLDNYSCTKPDKDGLPTRNVELIRASLLDPGAMEKASEGQDFIFHLAAHKYVDISIKDPVGSARENLVGMVNLLHCAVKNKVKKVFFASSAAIYGNNPTMPLKETESPDPQSPYALEKIVGEQYLKLFYNLYGLDSAAMRFFNVYGPKQYSANPHCGGVTIVFDQLKKHNYSDILGDGSQTRDMIYVGDIVNALIMAMHHDKPLRGEMFNLCSGTRVSVRYLHESIAEVMGKHYKAEGDSRNHEGAEFHHLPFHEGNVVHSQGDYSKALGEFGWTPRVDLKEGLLHTYEWNERNPDFYK